MCVLIFFGIFVVERLKLIHKWSVSRKNGLPILPPVGVPDELLDDIQLKIFQYCNKIEPRYIPKIEIVEYQGVNLVYLKCAAGDAGPYQAPVDVYSKRKRERSRIAQ